MKAMYLNREVLDQMKRKQNDDPWLPNIRKATDSLGGNTEPPRNPSGNPSSFIAKNLQNFAQDVRWRKEA